MLRPVQWLIIAATLASCSTGFVSKARADLATELGPVVDAQTRPLIVRPGQPVGYAGIAVGVIRGHEVATFGYGSTHLQTGVDAAPNGRTVFEIGSITKTFTGLLLAHEVDAERIRLADPLRDCKPVETSAFCYQGRATTWVDLATHTSGLPRLPDLSHEDPANPYGKYTAEQLARFLDQLKLTRAPGAEQLYSNLGMNVLAHEISERRARGFEELVVDQIATPLGMNDTRVWLTAEQRARFAQGYSDGQAVPYWERAPSAVLLGSGALRSTVDDLLKYLGAQLGVRDGIDPAVIRLTQAEHFKINDRRAMGLSWEILRTQARIKGQVENVTWHWHNGATGGFSTFIAFDRVHQVGVVMLANSNLSDEKSDLDRRGASILRALTNSAAGAVVGDPGPK